MKAFIDAAHARGRGIVVDFVMNHWGPNDLPMWCLDGTCLGNGGAYFYADGRASTPWGQTRPDYGRPEIRSYVKDAAMGLYEYRVDGLRWDGTKWIRTIGGDGSGDIPDGWSLMQWVNSESARQPWKIKLAEDFGRNGAITGGGGAGFDSQWDDAFVHPVRDAVIQSNDAWRSMAAVRDAVAHSFNGQAMQRIVYTESHDEVANGQQRLPEAIWPGNAASSASKKRSTLAAAIAFTSPGIPMIFEGQEFLEGRLLRRREAARLEQGRRVRRDHPALPGSGSPPPQLVRHHAGAPGRPRQRLPRQRQRQGDRLPPVGRRRAGRRRRRCRQLL
jgi:1,4-alpha-glucan branching enzyme